MPVIVVAAFAVSAAVAAVWAFLRRLDEQLAAACRLTNMEET